MAKTIPILRKRRTREHVIASQSANFVERLLIDEGHTAERVENDYGYDLILFTYDAGGHVEPGHVFIQLKATEKIVAGPDAQTYHFSLSIADYNLWRDEPMPVFLVMYDAVRRRAYWLYVQQYFQEDNAREPRKGAHSIRIHIPAANRMSRWTIRYARNRKREICRQIQGMIDHA